MDADTLREKLSELRDLLAHKKGIPEKTGVDADRAKSDDNCRIAKRRRLMEMHNRALQSQRECADSISTYEGLLLEKTPEILVDDNSQLPTAQRIAAGP